MWLAVSEHQMQRLRTACDRRGVGKQLEKVGYTYLSAAPPLEDILMVELRLQFAVDEKRIGPVLLGAVSRHACGQLFFEGEVDHVSHPNFGKSESLHERPGSCRLAWVLMCLKVSFLAASITYNFATPPVNQNAILTCFCWTSQWTIPCRN